MFYYNTFIQISIFLLSTLSFSQISDTWYWNYDNYKHNLELKLELIGSELKGFHCSSFNNGRKIDCIEETSNIYNCSIDLIEVSVNVYEGALKSGFSNTDGVVRITYLINTDEVLFEIIQEPTGEYYLPNNITMTKTQ